MAGQIIKKADGVYLVRIEARKDGKRQTLFSQQVKGTKKAAQKLLNEKLTEADKGELVAKNTATLKSYLEEWLETIAKTRVREATFNSYKFHLERYIYHALGERKLADLRPLEIQRHYNKLNETYAPRTVSYTHTILKNALKSAVGLRYLANNPCERVTPPKKRKREMKAFSPVQAQKFLEAAANDKHGLIFEVALSSGMRPEEYLALKWTDVDFVRGTATVQRALVWRKGGGWYFAELKTESSRRTVSLPVPIIAKLKHHRVKQAEYRLKLGAVYQNNDLCFATEEGQPLRYGNLTRSHFRPILKAAELGHFRLYDLRHSCATLLLAAGVNPKIVSERLGHSDITLTLNTYSHILPDMQQAATDELETMLYRKNGTF